MKTCSRCGRTDIDDKADFCPGCGMKLDTTKKDEKPENRISSTYTTPEYTAPTYTTPSIPHTAPTPRAQSTTPSEQVPTQSVHNTEYTQQPKPKKKKTGAIIALFIVLGVLIILAGIGFVFMIRDMGKKGNDESKQGEYHQSENYTIYYDSRGIYEYDITTGESDMLTKLDDDYSDMNTNIADMVKISSDGKYATYIKDLEINSSDYTEYGTLYYTDRTLSEDKREDVKIAEHVIESDILVDDTIIYLTENYTLYRVNPNAEDLDKRRLGSFVGTHQMSKDGYTYMWVNETGSMYTIKSGEDKEKKLADDIYIMEYVSDDLNNIYYTNYDYDLKCISEDKGSTLIDTDVFAVYPIEGTGHIYYTKDYKDASLGDFVIDRTGVMDVPVEEELDGYGKQEIKEESSEEESEKESSEEESEMESSEEETTKEADASDETDASNETEEMTLSSFEYEYLRELYEEYGGKDYYSSFEEFYDDYMQYLYEYGDDYGIDFGIDDDYGDYYGDSQSWQECLDETLPYVGWGTLYLYDGKASTKVSDYAMDVTVLSDIKDDRICYVSCKQDKVTVTEVPSSIDAFKEEIINDEIGTSPVNITIGSLSVELGIERAEYQNTIVSLVHNCTEDSIYYSIYDYEDDTDDTDDYGYYEGYDSYDDYYDYHIAYKTYKIDYDSSGAKKPVEVGDDIGFIMTAVGDKYITLDYADEYNSSISDMYMNGEKIAVGVYNYVYDDENASSPIDVMENTFVEDDYSGLGTILGNITRYDGSETIDIIDSVSRMCPYKDGHYEFLCDYDDEEAEGAYYYWDGVTDHDPVLVADNVAGISTSDIE